MTMNERRAEIMRILTARRSITMPELVSKYGAELARDWYDVFLVKRVGNDTDVAIREKKNLTGISYDVDETDVVTRIMPTGEDADGNVLYLPELYLDSPNLSVYTHPKWIHLPVSEAKEVTDGDEPKSKAQCYAEMRKAAQAEFDAGCDLPTVTLKVDFVNCSDAEEYKQYAALTDIFLGDSVRVIARRIGVEVSMRMTQYTYDCLTRKYTSVTLGTAADTLEGSIISSRQLPSGVISGSKLAINSVGAGQLQSGSVGSLQVKMAAIQTAHIQDAAITKAKIAEATIGELNATAITAISAKIQELAAKNITTDELYQSRMNGYAVGRQNGWMSANDIRELENLDRIPAEAGGDLYLINGNMTKLADAGLFAGKKDNRKEPI